VANRGFCSSRCARRAGASTNSLSGRPPDEGDPESERSGGHFVRRDGAPHLKGNHWRFDDDRVKLDPGTGPKLGDRLLDGLRRSVRGRLRSSPRTRRRRRGSVHPGTLLRGQAVGIALSVEPPVVMPDPVIPSRCLAGARACSLGWRDGAAPTPTRRPKVVPACVEFLRAGLSCRCRGGRRRLTVAPPPRVSGRVLARSASRPERPQP
jgi:hypothetical protein